MILGFIKEVPPEIWAIIGAVITGFIAFLKIFYKDFAKRWFEYQLKRNTRFAHQYRVLMRLGAERLMMKIKEDVSASRVMVVVLERNGTDTLRVVMDFYDKELDSAESELNGLLMKRFEKYVSVLSEQKFVGIDSVADCGEYPLMVNILNSFGTKAFYSFAVSDDVWVCIAYRNHQILSQSQKTRIETELGRLEMAWGVLFNN